MASTYEEVLAVLHARNSSYLSLTPRLQLLEALENHVRVCWASQELVILLVASLFSQTEGIKHTHTQRSTMLNQQKRSSETTTAVGRLENVKSDKCVYRSRQERGKSESQWQKDFTGKKPESEGIFPCQQERRLNTKTCTSFKAKTKKTTTTPWDEF